MFRSRVPMIVWLTAAMLVSLAPLSGQGGPVGGRLPDAPKSEKPPKPTPRLADGHPDLGNGKGTWNPRTVVNLSGGGRQGPARSPVERQVEIPFLPWSKAYYEKAQANLAIDDPEARCLPPGVPRMTATPFPFQIFQLPDRVMFAFEGGAHMWRQIPTDGRPHSKDPNPTYLGESVGHWEGDTLVVDVIGFNERTWLDQDGHPHSDKLHVIEKYTRTDEMTLHFEVMIDDPGAYAEKWSNSYTIPWVPGGELMEYVCQENNQDLYHMAGK
ncbi:MAG: hypothetical protein ABI824_09765 [Acidobacteriota bacterium]